MEMYTLRLPGGQINLSRANFCATAETNATYLERHLNPRRAAGDALDKKELLLHVGVVLACMQSDNFYSSTLLTDHALRQRLVSVVMRIRQSGVWLGRDATAILTIFQHRTELLQRK